VAELVVFLEARAAQQPERMLRLAPERGSYF
jgi:hypothetical protein